MRSLHPDRAYFDFLDGIRTECCGQTRLIVAELLIEFPLLCGEEALAIFCDWRNRQADVTLPGGLSH